MQQDAASTTGPDLEQDTTALATAHRFKLRPPTFDGNYATFEEWKYKFTAYMGLMDAIYPRSETATTRLTDTELMAAAAPPPDQQQQFADNTNTRWGRRSFDSPVNGSQYHLEHAASATSPNFSSRNSTTTTSRSLSQHGSSN